MLLLSTAPQNKVTIVSKRHSGNLLAGIQKYGLDTGLRRYDELAVANWRWTVICVALYLEGKHRRKNRRKLEIQQSGL